MLRIVLGILCGSALSLSAQQQASAPRYPVMPRALPDSEEVALALSAAPDEVSSRADVYALRGAKFAKIRSGSNGVACMVSRDYHEGSAYPICFDREGVKSIMPREMRELSMRAQNIPEAEIVRTVEAEIASGKLPTPSKPALAYMMSPRQVIFSSPHAEGVRVGKWWPHIMMAKLGLSKEQIGLLPSSTYRYIQAGGESGSLHEFVVLVAAWSDGTPANDRGGR
jgi:hypothetical protein